MAPAFAVFPVYAVRSVRRYYAPLRLHCDSKQRQNKKPVICRLALHVRDALFTQDIIFPIVKQIVTHDRLAVTLHIPGCEYLMFCLRVPVPMVDGYDHSLAHKFSPPS